MEPDSQPAPIPTSTNTLVCGDQGRHHLRPGVGVEAQSFGAWGREEATAKWTQLEKAAFGS